jgi:hypothetical protein
MRDLRCGTVPWHSEEFVTSFRSVIVAITEVVAEAQ